MNELPGARLRVGLTGRMSISGTKRARTCLSSTIYSALPKPVPKCPPCRADAFGGLPAHLGHGNGALQERITSTKRLHYSVQAIYVPADDLTDPATAFAHLMPPPSSRQIAELGIYPAVDPDLPDPGPQGGGRRTLPGSQGSSAGAPAL